jgi:hypothetical protein
MNIPGWARPCNNNFIGDNGGTVSKFIGDKGELFNVLYKKLIG